MTPVDIALAEDIDLLVITGPNTGGKSVALKTLGISALMVQCGIPILAAPESRIPLFDKVFTDIGDQQNVADDLSTFSGHVKNLGEILSDATAASLVLLDEPGTGTDPEDGAALAKVILDELSHRGARTLATTHFQTVKVAALSHPRTRVAAVDFHSETFAPKYRLIYDSIGPSLGLVMARRLGLPSLLIQQAEEERSEGTADLSAALEKLEIQRRKLESEVSDTVAERRKFKTQRSEQERLVAELQEKKQRKWSEELGAARRFAEELRREGRKLLDEAKNNPAQFAKPLMDLAREQRKSIVVATKRHASPPEKESAPAEQPKIGDQVRIRSNGLVGELLELHGDRARIAREKSVSMLPRISSRKSAGSHQLAKLLPVVAAFESNEQHCVQTTRIWLPQLSFSSLGNAYDRPWTGSTSFSIIKHLNRASACEWSTVTARVLCDVPFTNNSPYRPMSTISLRLPPIRAEAVPPLSIFGADPLTNMK